VTTKPVISVLSVGLYGGQHSSRDRKGSPSTNRCKLLQGWALSKYCSAWLDSNEGIQASSAVLELYVRTGLPKTRVLKFRGELENTLRSGAMAGMADCVSFYPDVPVKCEGKTSWMGFERALDWLGTQQL
jgi:hypothetical protein